MLYFSETMLFSVRSSNAKEFDFDFCVSTQSSVLFWSRLMTCSLRVSLLFDLSIKLLSELMILSSALMNFRFAADFGLREREKFWLMYYESWSLWRKLLSLLFDHLNEKTKWLINVLWKFASIMCLAQCFTDFFNESFVNQNVDVIYEVKHLDFNF